jgi:phage virion morphogenesis protein
MIDLQFNHDAIFRRLEAAARVLDDLTPIHQDIGDYMVEATKARFKRSEAPDGSRWQTKKPSTIARYLDRGDGHRPDPLIGPSGRLGREINYFANRGGVELGSALEYASVMQHGAKKGAFGTDVDGRKLPWNDIPARVWLGISETDERKILDIVDEHLAEAIGE